MLEKKNPDTGVSGFFRSDVGIYYSGRAIRAHHRRQAVIPGHVSVVVENVAARIL